MRAAAGCKIKESTVLDDAHCMDVIDKYRSTNDKLFMSLEESVLICTSLAHTVRQSGWRVDAVVGIANGALLPTHVIAEALECDYEYIRIRRRASTIKRRLGRILGVRTLFSWLYSIRPIARLLRWVIEPFNTLEHDTAPPSNTEASDIGHILLVDDAIDSGQSIAAGIELLKARGACEIRTAVISWSDAYDSATQYGVTPEYFFNRRVQHYPWSENNPAWANYRDWLQQHNLQEWN